MISGWCPAPGVLSSRRMRDGQGVPHDLASAEALFREGRALMDRGELDAACMPYWQSRGFTVTQKASAARKGENFHPIYSLPAGAARQALDEMPTDGLDVIVMLGTGMPTLPPIARRAAVTLRMLMLGGGTAAAAATRRRAAWRSQSGLPCCRCREWRLRKRFRPSRFALSCRSRRAAPMTFWRA